MSEHKSFISIGGIIRIAIGLMAGVIGYTLFTESSYYEIPLMYSIALLVGGVLVFFMSFSGKSEGKTAHLKFIAPVLLIIAGGIPFLSSYFGIGFLEVIIYNIAYAIGLVVIGLLLMIGGFNTA